MMELMKRNIIPASIYILDAEPIQDISDRELLQIGWLQPYKSKAVK